MKDGCNIQLQNISLKTENNSLLMTFSSPLSLRANGYYFSVLNCSVDTCPSNWILEAFVQEDTKWKTIGASTWRFDSSTALTVYYPKIPFIDKLANGSDVVIDYQADWKWCLQFLGVNSVCAVGWFLMSLCGIFKRERSSVRFWQMYLVIVSAICLVLFVCYVLEGDWRNSIIFWFWFCPLSTLCLGITFYQSLLIYHLLVYGTLQATGKLLESILFTSSQNEVLVSVLESTGFVVVIACLILLAFRWRILTISRGVVRRDKQFYNSLWSELLSSEETVEQLHKLKIIIKQIQLEGVGPLQLRSHSIKDPQNHRSLASLSIQSLHSLFDSSTNTGSKIESLDQLYFQAHCLYPILLHKVKLWAQSSSGLFPIRTELAGESNLEYVRWTDIQADPSLNDRLCWAKIKSVERAIEKVVRTYKHVSLSFHFLKLDLNLALTFWLIGCVKAC